MNKMDFIIRMPASYSLTITEKIEKEERFKRAFRSLIYKYADHEVPYEKNGFVNIEYDHYANYLRLKTLSPQYPKEMQEEIVEVLGRVFNSSNLSIPLL